MSPLYPMPDQKTMQTSCLGVFRYVGNKTFNYIMKIRIFCPKMAIFMLSLAHVGYAGLFGALLVGRSVVVARVLYLARHFFTFSRGFSLLPNNLSSIDERHPVLIQYVFLNNRAKTWLHFQTPSFGCLSLDFCSYRHIAGVWQKSNFLLIKSDLH